jgi:hypothetical protein
MMGKKRTITPTFLRRYEVLRRLYLGPKTINELFVECPHMNKLQVITSLSNLLKNRAIRKEPIAEESPKAVDEFFNEDSKRIKKRMKHQYVIIPSGCKKLAYWEWRWKMYEKVKFEWSDDFNQPYYDEMTHLITEVLKLPIA